MSFKNTRLTLALLCLACVSSAQAQIEDSLSAGELAELCENMLVPPKLAAKIQKDFLTRVMARGEIPATGTLSDIFNETLSDEKFGVSGEKSRALADLLSTGYRTEAEMLNAWVDGARRANPKAWGPYIDRRFYTQEYCDKRRQAIAESNRLIVFRIPEDYKGDSGNIAAQNAVETFAARAVQGTVVIGNPYATERSKPELPARWNKSSTFYWTLERTTQLPGIHLIDIGNLPKNQNPLAGYPFKIKDAKNIFVFAEPRLLESKANPAYAIEPTVAATTGGPFVPEFSAMYGAQLRTATIAANGVDPSIMVLDAYGNPRFDGVDTFGTVMPRRAPVRYYAKNEGTPQQEIGATVFDLGRFYFEDGTMEKATLFPAIIWGDTHFPKTDPRYLTASLEFLGSIGVLKKAGDHWAPGRSKLERLVLHDQSDGLYINRHVEGWKKSILDSAGALSIADAALELVAHLHDLHRLLPETIIVMPRNNHFDDWLDQWMNRIELNQMPGHQARVWVELRSLKLRYPGVPTGELLLRAAGLAIPEEKARFLSAGEGMLVELSPGELMEIGQHGDLGLNGARRLGIKPANAAYGQMTSAHTHLLQENGGVLNPGTATEPRQEYHLGASGSAQGMVVVARSTERAVGAAQLMLLANGSFLPAPIRGAPLRLVPNGSLQETPPIPTVTESGTSDVFWNVPSAMRGGRR